MTWTLVANLKGPKGDIGSWDGGNVATGADLATFYGSTTSPYRLVSYSVPSDATASSLIGAPKGAKAGTLTVVSLGSAAALHVWRNAADGREWQQAVYSNAASNTGWRETQRKGTKRVAEPLTVAGSALYNTSTDVGVRLPFRVPATPARWRVHIRNQNDRTSTAFSGALSFTGVSVGKAAVGADGRPTGQFNGGKNPVALAFTSSSTGGQWVSDWMDYTLLPGEDYILSYGYTSAAQNNHASVGGGWLTDLGSSAINTDNTALTPTKNAPLDVWMAYEVDEEVPQFAYFGDSLTAGVSADLPVYDSWAKRHAMANGAFAQVYAYSGTGYTEWTSALQSRFNKYTGFSGVAKPERLYVAMGSNDLSSADAATVRDRFNVTIPILKTFTSSSLYLLTVLPRLDATAAFETNRQAWNEILRTELPGNAIACYDAAEALEDYSGSVLDPKWRASESDIHLNRAGYARYAAALTAAGGSASGTASVATLAALPAANPRNQGNTYYVEAEGKPYFSNGTTWQPVSSGEAGPSGPTGAGVPEGGTAFQVVRKDAAGVTTEWVSPDKTMVGLSNVDNTPDAEKPVSTPQASALAALSAGYVIAAEPSGSDDTAALNALAASATGKTMMLKAGRVYKINDTIVVPTGTKLDLNGATIDATAIPAGTALGQRKAISVTGSLGADLPVTTAIPQWSRVVAGISSTTGLAAGDLVLVSNDERPVPGMTRTDRDKGHLAIIRSVDSSTQVTLVQGAYLAYGTTSLTIRKVNAVRDVTIKNGTILMGGVGSAHNAVFVQYGRDILTENLNVVGAEDSGISYLTVWNGRIRGNDVKGSTSSGTLGNTGYGVAVTEASAHVTVTGNDFENCRHWVAGGGQWPAAYVDVTENHGTSASSAGYECHESSYYWKFVGNTATGCDTAFLIRGQYVTVDGNEINESSANSILVTTYDLVTEQRGIRVINNTDHRSAFGIKIDGQTGIDQPDSVKINLEVRGNEVKNCGGSGIMVRHFDGATVADNTVDGTVLEGIRFIGLSGTRSKYLTLGANKIRNTTTVGLRLENVDDVDAAGGAVVKSGNYGVQVESCNRTNWTGMSVQEPTLSGLFINLGSIHSVNGATIAGTPSGNYDAIRVTGSSNLTVTGGYLSSPRHAIYSTTTENVTVAGVNAKNAVHATKINVDAVSKMVANNLI